MPLIRKQDSSAGNSSSSAAVRDDEERGCTNSNLLALEDAAELCNQTGALTASLARTETQVVTILRTAVLCVFLITAGFVCSMVFIYTRNQERENFTTYFEHSATQVIQSFHSVVERNLAAVASMSTSITSYANTNVNNSNGGNYSGFPFVTMPDFELRGSDLRATSGSHLIHWCPLVTDDNRLAWEEYALQQRFHATESFQLGEELRKKQDEEYGVTNATNINSDGSSDTGTRTTNLQDVPELTVLDDGTNFHPRIWSNGAVFPRGDEPEGGGKYLPLWQQSPQNDLPGAQAMLNVNVANVILVSRGIIEIMSTQKKALLNYVAEPIPIYKPYMENILSLSQYRHDVQNLIDDLHTALSYPVFDSFDDDREMAGILVTDVYWKNLFSNLLPQNLQGIICVVENSFNQTFTYRIDGPDATFLGMNDHHDPKYNDLEVSTNVNAYLEEKSSPTNRAFKTVGISDSIQYTIKVFPSQDTEDTFITNQPVLYTVVIMCAFLFAAALFLAYSYGVERRQRVMTKKVIENIKRAAETERELNEFLSHEVRNPLSAAISASTFVTTAVNEAEPLHDEETKKYVREDIEVVNSSLHFINDFLRSMLDIYRASGNKISVAKAPTDILRDILEPVSCILYKRLSAYEVIVECKQDLMVMTDSMRLKQVILNLARNSSKFVERGFLRIRADVVDNCVRIYVEDSGPGISPKKKKELFAKYQESLDLLCQGTGIGLNLSKKLMNAMNGDLWLDDSYHSGVDSCPGACFVVDLNSPPLDIESILPPVDTSDAIRDEMAKQGEQDGPVKSASSSTTTSESTAGITGETAKDEILDPTSVTKPFPISVKEYEVASELPGNLSVLFVDDDVVLRKLFIRAVQKASPESWKIRDASSGEMALKLCETEKFDLIFMDQYMASIDKQLLGTETTMTMRSRGVTSKICGLSANDLRDAFVNAGADEFILKPMPCKPPDLKRLLLKILYPSHVSVREFVPIEPGEGEKDICKVDPFA